MLFIKNAALLKNEISKSYGGLGKRQIYNLLEPCCMSIQIKKTDEFIEEAKSELLKANEAFQKTTETLNRWEKN